MKKSWVHLKITVYKIKSDETGLRILIRKPVSDFTFALPAAQYHYRLYTRRLRTFLCGLNYMTGSIKLIILYTLIFQKMY